MWKRSDKNGTGKLYIEGATGNQRASTKCCFCNHHFSPRLVTTCHLNLFNVQSDVWKTLKKWKCGFQPRNIVKCSQNVWPGPDLLRCIYVMNSLCFNMSQRYSKVFFFQLGIRECRIHKVAWGTEFLKHSQMFTFWYVLQFILDHCSWWCVPFALFRQLCIWCFSFYSCLFLCPFWGAMHHLSVSWSPERILCTWHLIAWSFTVPIPSCHSCSLTVLFFIVECVQVCFIWLWGICVECLISKCLFYLAYTMLHV